MSKKFNHEDFSHWIFDLDNTLYSATTNVFGKIDKKMCEFIMENREIEVKESIKLKKIKAQLAEN